MQQKAKQGDIAENKFTVGQNKNGVIGYWQNYVFDPGIKGTGYKDGYKNLEGVGVGTRFVRAEGGSWENGDVIHVQGIGEEGNPIYGKLALGVTAMDVTAIKSMELGFRYSAASMTKYSVAKSLVNGSRLVKGVSTGLGFINLALNYADYKTNDGQLHSAIDMGVSTLEIIFPEVALAYGIADLAVKGITGKTISENIQEIVEKVPKTSGMVYGPFVTYYPGGFSIDY